MTITTRAGKGSTLTWPELDGNFTDLDHRTEAGWFDIVSEFYTRDGPAAPGVSQFVGGIYLLEFSDTDTLEAFASYHIPHAYKPGTMIYPHVHFSVKSNDGGVVRWGFEWTFARSAISTGQTAFPATQTIYIDYTVPAGSAYKHFIAEAPEGQGIPGTNIEVDGVVLSRVFREPAHPNDTFVGSAWAIFADLHTEVDRFATPLRVPNFYG